LGLFVDIVAVRAWGLAKRKEGTAVTDDAAISRYDSAVVVYIQNYVRWRVNITTETAEVHF
jgi:hypothetical protein